MAVWLKDRGEVTLKRFYHEGDRVRLQPANSTMKPIYTTAENVEIQGQVHLVVSPQRLSDHLVPCAIIERRAFGPGPASGS